MDELAHAAGIDPVAFRLRHLVDERAPAVIEAAAEKTGWSTPLRNDLDTCRRGRGIGFARYKNEKVYAAVVVDLNVDLLTGSIHLERAVIAVDAGQIVNPDGVAN